MCHKQPSAELEPSDQIGHSRAVVVMEVRYEAGVHVRDIEPVPMEVRESIATAAARVHSAVKHDGFVPVTQQNAGPAHLLPSTERNDLDL